ncbi:MAG: hypothetical protein JO265_09030 [Acidimicrobiia bacterium]|nr:hypothetical protein [Acidimicrobiia bacterium]
MRFWDTEMLYWGPFCDAQGDVWPPGDWSGPAAALDLQRAGRAWRFSVCLAHGIAAVQGWGDALPTPTLWPTLLRVHGAAATVAKMIDAPASGSATHDALRHLHSQQAATDAVEFAGRIARLALGVAGAAGVSTRAAALHAVAAEFLQPRVPYFLPAPLRRSHSVDLEAGDPDAMAVELAGLLENARLDGDVVLTVGEVHCWWDRHNALHLEQRWTRGAERHFQPVDLIEVAHRVLSSPSGARREKWEAGIFATSISDRLLVRTD